METKITDREGYHFVVSKRPLARPEGTYHVEFKKEIYDEEGLVEWSTKFDMFLTEEEIKLVKEAL
mgnify:CR=1 FL=1